MDSSKLTPLDVALALVENNSLPQNMRAKFNLSELELTECDIAHILEEIKSKKLKVHTPPDYIKECELPN